MAGRRLHLVQEGSVTDGQASLTVEALPGETMRDVATLGVMDKEAARALMHALHLFVSACENPDALRQCNEPRRGKGYRLKELRERKKVTQVQLAMQIGCSSQTIAFIETGRRHHIRLDVLLPMASFFDMTVEELATYLGLLPRTINGNGPNRHAENTGDNLDAVRDNEERNGTETAFAKKVAQGQKRRVWKKHTGSVKGGVVHTIDRKQAKKDQKEVKTAEKHPFLDKKDVFSPFSGDTAFLPPLLRIPERNVQAKKNSK